MTRWTHGVQIWAVSSLLVTLWDWCCPQGGSLYLKWIACIFCLVIAKCEVKMPGLDTWVRHFFTPKIEGFVTFHDFSPNWQWEIIIPVQSPWHFTTRHSECFTVIKSRMKGILCLKPHSCVFLAVWRAERGEARVECPEGRFHDGLIHEGLG